MADSVPDEDLRLMLERAQRLEMIVNVYPGVRHDDIRTLVADVRLLVDTVQMYEGMREGVQIRIADLEAAVERLHSLLQELRDNCACCEDNGPCANCERIGRVLEPAGLPVQRQRPVDEPSDLDQNNPVDVSRETWQDLYARNPDLMDYDREP